jgi:hypothetical protein
VQTASLFETKSIGPTISGQIERRKLSKSGLTTIVVNRDHSLVGNDFLFSQDRRVNLMVTNYALLVTRGTQKYVGGEGGIVNVWKCT